MFSASNNLARITPISSLMSADNSDRYVSGYFPDDPNQSLEEQLHQLTCLFPGSIPQVLHPFVASDVCIPEGIGVEKSFVIPHWSLISSSYEEAVLHLCSLLSQERNGQIENKIFYLLHNQRLRETPVKTQFWKELIDLQRSKILTVPGQFGANMMGKSIREANMLSLFLPDTPSVFQVCFGLYEALIMLLTHPNRLSSDQDLWLLLPGDQIAADVPNVYRSSPVIRYLDGKILIDTLGFDEKLPELGTVSGFLFLKVSTITP